MCNIATYTYCVYLYRSPGVEFLKILIQHLNQYGMHLFLLSHLDAGTSIGVSMVRGHHIYKTVWIPLIDETLQAHSA